MAMKSVAVVSSVAIPTSPIPLPIVDAANANDEGDDGGSSECDTIGVHEKSTHLQLQEEEQEVDVVKRRRVGEQLSSGGI